MKREDERHESYGIASFSRVSGSARLFNCSVDSMHHVTLSISTARLVHNDSYCDSMVMDEKEIVEVAMSANQFAELITQMNVGCGVPVTIRRRDGKIVQPPTSKPVREKFTEDLEEDIREASDLADEAARKAEELLNKKTITVADRKEILKLIGSWRSLVRDSIPFAHKLFNEAMDKTVTEAKAEVDSFTESKIRSLGIEKLTSMVDQLSIPSSSDVFLIEGKVVE